MLSPLIEAAVMGGVLTMFGAGFIFAFRKPKPAAQAPASAPVDDRPASERAPELARAFEALAASGFFRDLDEDDMAWTRERFCERREVYTALGDAVWVYDEEELGECGVGDMLEDMRPVLEGCGVKLGVVQQRVVPGLQVWVSIDGRGHELLEAGEVDTLAEAAERVTAAAFKLLDTLLATAGAPERAYRVRGEYDAAVIIMRPEQAEAVMAAIALTGEAPPEAPVRA